MAACARQRGGGGGKGEEGALRRISKIPKFFRPRRNWAGQPSLLLLPRTAPPLFLQRVESAPCDRYGRLSKSGEREGAGAGRSKGGTRRRASNRALLSLFSLSLSPSVSFATIFPAASTPSPSGRPPCRSPTAMNTRGAHSPLAAGQSMPVCKPRGTAGSPAGQAVAVVAAVHAQSR